MLVQFFEIRTYQSIWPVFVNSGREANILDVDRKHEIYMERRFRSER